MSAMSDGGVRVMRGKRIKNRKEFEMVKGKVSWMTSETGVKWGGDKNVKRRVNTNTDLVACQDRWEISLSFTANDGGDRRGPNWGEDSFFGNKPMGKVGSDQKVMKPVHRPFI